MRLSGLNSVLAVFLMITMASTGCVDDLEPADADEDDWDDLNEEDSQPGNYSVIVDSLEAVFDSMNDDGEYYYDREQWVIHDISEIVEIDGMLMFGVTGKAQEDGYNCGLETWYIFPGESEFTPGPVSYTHLTLPTKA